MKTVSTAVGDRYVLEYMREHDLSVGGEQSGHVIFLDHNTTGDGMLTAVQVAALVKEKGQPLSELASIMTKIPTSSYQRSCCYKDWLGRKRYY